MSAPTLRTIGELKASGYAPHSVREEIRTNILAALKSGEALFPGVVGYEDTVIPALINAILSRHDILLLGLRGQAKTRLLRSLVNYLDEYVPVVPGTALNEDPLDPITDTTRDLIAAKGDDLPIGWMHRSERFNEKLATPDVSIADIIGDIDPIRASREQLDLSDERVIHYGIVPRTNRGLFCINEIPDLQPRIQVGLLNLLEERDLQIRGFPIRIELDILMMFTANPEDYTNRGSIITPLKDRIATQIITHYPHELDDAIAITEQEADTARSVEANVPTVVKAIVEHIAIQARQSEHVDQSSGVSARLSISAMEMLHSNIERRHTLFAGSAPVPRISDVYALVPAVTGKVELVYEGQEAGAEAIASKLIGNAVKAVFSETFPPVYSGGNGVKADGRAPSEEDDPYAAIQAWFSAGNRIELTENLDDAAYAQRLDAVEGLQSLVHAHLPDVDPSERSLYMELILEGLFQHSLLSKEGLGGAKDRTGAVYTDMLASMLNDF